MAMGIFRRDQRPKYTALLLNNGETMCKKRFRADSAKEASYQMLDWVGGHRERNWDSETYQATDLEIWQDDMRVVHLNAGTLRIQLDMRLARRRAKRELEVEAKTAPDAIRILGLSPEDEPLEPLYRKPPLAALEEQEAPTTAAPSAVSEVEL